MLPGTELKPSIQPHSPGVLPEQTPTPISLSVLPRRVPPRNPIKGSQAVSVPSTFRAEKARSGSPNLRHRWQRLTYLPAPSQLPRRQEALACGPGTLTGLLLSMVSEGWGFHAQLVSPGRSMLAPGFPGMWGKGGWPGGVGRPAGTCEVIPSTNNKAELARPVLSPPPSPSQLLSKYQMSRKLVLLLKLPPQSHFGGTWVPESLFTGKF